MGRHRQGRHRRGPEVELRAVLRAAAVTATVLTLVVTLIPSRARDAALVAAGSGGVPTSFALPQPPAASTTFAAPYSSTSPAPTIRLLPSAPTSSRMVAPVVVPPAPITPGAPPASSSFGERVVAGARLFIGVPYVWGGITTLGMDCSGLVYTVLRALGKNPPRTSAEQARWTTRISKADARPGDLVFGVRAGVVHHVGIYLGNDQMIDSPNSGSVVGVHHLYRDSTLFGRVP